MGNNFKEIVKKGLTYSSSKGKLTPQSLYKMPLKGSFSLDEVGKILLSELDEHKVTSLVDGDSSSINADDQLRLDVLKEIIEDKKIDIAQKIEKEANDSYNYQLDQLIRKRKQEEMTIEELEALRK